MPKKRHWFFDPYKYQVRTGIVPEFPDGHVIKTHSHPWHQLVYASQGVMTVRTPEGAWVVPIHRGVWVPAGTRHSIEMSGHVSLRTLYLVPRLSRSLPDEPRVIGISPLLRELILRIVELDSLNLRNPAHAHLVSVLLDHLHVMQSDAVHLPLPRDARAKRIAAMLQKEPSDNRSLIELSKLAGASKRTDRALVQERNRPRLRQMASATTARSRAAIAGRRRPGHDGRDGRRLRQHQRIHLGVSDDLRQNPRPVFPRRVSTAGCSARALCY